jgi:hypothetical protein
MSNLLSRKNVKFCVFTLNRSKKLKFAELIQINAKIVVITGAAPKEKQIFCSFGVLENGRVCMIIPNEKLEVKIDRFLLPLFS